MARQVNPVGRVSYSRPGRPGRPKKGIKLPGRGWFKLVLAVATLVAIWRYFGIQTIELQQVETLNQQAIELAVRKGIKAQLLGENLITLNAGRLESFVTTAIPEIRDLEIKRKWPKGIVVSIVEREPSLAWRSGGVLYLLDRDGTVIRELNSRGAKQAIVTDTTNLPVKVGSRAVPERFVSFTLEAVKELRGVGGGIKRLTVTDTTSELHARLGDGYLVKLDTTREAKDQVKSLKLVLEQLGRQGKRPAEYIDLRVEGKVYYK